MNEEELWYFAYGSNLDPQQLQKRIGECRSSIKHILLGYRLVFNVKSKHWGGYTANMLASGNSQDKVYGVKYRITKQLLEKLTECEGIDPRYLQEIEAYSYIFRTTRPGSKAPSDYLDTMIRGLVFHGYGNDVIAEVRKIADP